MTIPTDINRRLHEKVMGNGKIWHEPMPSSMGGLCVCGYLHPDLDSHYSKANPDYLNNKSDSRDFLTWFLEEWEDRDNFLIHWHVINHIDTFNLDSVHKALLINTITLPTEVYTYCKEREDG